MILDAKQLYDAKLEQAVRRARRSLDAYTVMMWRHLEPGVPLVWSRHMSAITEHLEAFRRGEIDHLLINCPPGMSKSTLGSRSFPTFCWLDDPKLRIIFASYDLDIALDENARRRGLMLSPLYQRLRPDWSLLVGDKAKSKFSNTRQGYMLACSVDSGITSKHADFIIVDDPMTPKEAYSRERRERVIWWWDKELMSRFRDRPRWILIMQRLHESDLAGELLGRGGSICHLKLQTEYDPKVHCRTPIGWEDWRRTPGELLAPDREKGAREAVEERKRDKLRFAAEDQQEPMALSGNIVDPAWWRPWPQLPPGGRWVGSWDFTVGSGKDQDFAVGQVWYIVGPDAHLVDQFRDRMQFHEMLWAFRAMATKWPCVGTWLVEKRAAGKDVLAMMRREYAGVIERHPDGDTEHRAATCAPLIQGGNVFLPGAGAARPHAMQAIDVGAYLAGMKLRADEITRARDIVSQAARWAPEDWLDTFRDEWAKCPAGTYDDCVDAAAQVLLYMRGQIGREPDDAAAATTPAPPREPRPSPAQQMVRTRGRGRPRHR